MVGRADVPSATESDRPWLDSGSAHLSKAGDVPGLERPWRHSTPRPVHIADGGCLYERMGALRALTPPHSLLARLGDGAAVVAFGERAPIGFPAFYQVPAFRYLTGFL